MLDDKVVIVGRVGGYKMQLDAGQSSKTETLRCTPAHIELLKFSKSPF